MKFLDRFSSGLIVGIIFTLILSAVISSDFSENIKNQIFDIFAILAALLAALIALRGPLKQIASDNQAREHERTKKVRAIRSRMPHTIEEAMKIVDAGTRIRLSRLKNSAAPDKIFININENLISELSEISEYCNDDISAMASGILIKR